jgi:hypothetical protein
MILKASEFVDAFMYQSVGPDIFVCRLLDIIISSSTFSYKSRWNFNRELLKRNRRTPSRNNFKSFGRTAALVLIYWTLLTRCTKWRWYLGENYLTKVDIVIPTQAYVLLSQSFVTLRNHLSTYTKNIYNNRKASPCLPYIRIHSNHCATLTFKPKATNTVLI